MATPEEVSAWSFEEILAEAQELLLDGSKVVYEQHPDGFWGVWVERTTADGVLINCRDTQADRRLAALNVFGQLWLKALPQPNEGSPWVRRKELSSKAIGSSVFPRIADPEDLDPIEVDLVYQSYRK